MKFGQYMAEQMVPEWKDMYLQYDELKRMIRILAEIESKAMAGDMVNVKAVSLTVPRPTNAAAQPAQTTLKLDHSDDEDSPSGGNENIDHEMFFELLEKEILKVQNFTHKKVEWIRTSLRDVGRRLGIDAHSVPSSQPLDITEAMRTEVERVGEEFLKLEKFVNLNYTAVHKILKKHDRWLPNPCRTFYLQRLQNQNWTRGDYSDVLVTMSRIYSCIRGDVAPEEVKNEKQDFVRSTTKYWVHDEDISRVKYIILQHLPVFLQKGMESTDSQLINSVYLDNATLELYKGRLEKTPGAIAVRFRWYGTGEPELVFVERKTHRDSWTMDVSVKERFIIQANEVQDLLAGKFDKQGHINKMLAKGKTESDIEDWNTLVTEVCQAINSKQLVPTLRTQYMRTAFQIPFDATVRVSLDTNLCMLTETGRLGKNDRWYRDPTQTIPPTEITRFPHSVLEVKLQLKDETSKPQWVTDIIESGMLQEVHKFSKFIHGSAVLLAEEVQAMPYWIDDPTLAESIAASGSAEVLMGEKAGANTIYGHLLPNAPSNRKTTSMQRRAAPVPRHTLGAPLGAINAPNRGGAQHHGDYYTYDDEDAGGRCLENCCGRLCDFMSPATGFGHMSIQKVEPKLFFANERTFIHWLNMAVTMSSLAAAVLAFSPEDHVSEVYGIILLPVAMMFAGYALYTYKWRAAKISTREQSRWDDPMGPVILASTFTLALTVQLLIKIWHVYHTHSMGTSSIVPVPSAPAASSTTPL